MKLKKIGLVAASTAAAGILVFGGATLASAATATPTPSASADSSNGTPGQGHEHTDVTGDEATKVTAAVTAKDSTVTVTSVRKDPDGSYDVFGTKNSDKAMFEVSADLSTVTQGTGRGHGGGGGGRDGSTDTAVTGDEATKVTAAVTAKDSTVTVTSVRKDPDGSYDVFGTKNSDKVMFEVSADLGTVTSQTAWPGKGHGPEQGTPDSDPSATPSTSPTN
ncbi:hypothetical protein [Catenuloplanes japonicus]|uniref:hypothetical protein n=1 Tax=Catenuloplanes japonicus TaxID=33876 RepID=UPI0007C47A60|nr:hypothetical protein [Catenuloplanes japonicus]